MYLSKQGIQKSLGPGILLAGAAIGGSHLLSSTTAGARFGFGLVGLILITNLLKYPFFCLLYTSPSPRDRTRSRMPSSA